MLPKLTILLSACGLCLTILGPTLSRTEVIPPMAGMILFLLSGVVGLAALFLAAYIAARHAAYFAAMVGVLGLLPLLAVVATAVQGMRYPPINDICTNLDAIPVFEHAPNLVENSGRDFAFPTDFFDDIKAHYGDLAPLKLELAPEVAYRRACDVAVQAPFDWTITRDDSPNLTFEAVATTRLFRWKDDIIVTIRSDETGSSFVEMRSKSRDGKSDLGANARRIRAFLAALRS